MCKLQESRYNCGHIRITLLEACLFTRRLIPIASQRAPDFCVNGLEVTQGIRVEGVCGRTYKNVPYVCSELAILVPSGFLDREAKVKTEFKAYGKRIDSMVERAKSDKLPVFNWEQLSREGWNVERLQGIQDNAWENVLPLELEELVEKFRWAERQISNISAHTVKTLLGKGFSRKVDVSSLPRAGTHGDENWRPYDIDEEEGPPLNLDLMKFEQEYEQVRYEVRNALWNMEEAMFMTCMDDVGWNLPEDKEMRVSLLNWIPYRVMQPLALSGTRLRDGFVQPLSRRTDSHWALMPEPARKTRQQEEWDAMDVAE